MRIIFLQKKRGRDDADDEVGADVAGSGGSAVGADGGDKRARQRVGSDALSGSEAAPCGERTALLLTACAIADRAFLHWIPSEHGQIRGEWVELRCRGHLEHEAVCAQIPTTSLPNLVEPTCLSPTCPEKRRHPLDRLCQASSVTTSLVNGHYITCDAF